MQGACSLCDGSGFIEVVDDALDPEDVDGGPYRVDAEDNVWVTDYCTCQAGVAKRQRMQEIMDQVEERLRKEAPGC